MCAINLFSPRGLLEFIWPLKPANIGFQRLWKNAPLLWAKLPKLEPSCKLRQLCMLIIIYCCNLREILWTRVNNSSFTISFNLAAPLDHRGGKSENKSETKLSLVRSMTSESWDAIVFEFNTVYRLKFDTTTFGPLFQQLSVGRKW